MEWTPVANAHVRRAGDAGGYGWEATGDDPQFMLRLPAPPAGGWYLFETRVAPTAGAIVAPCLYPDYGQGMSEFERVFLPEPDADGRIRAVVRLKAAAVALRFDPTTRAAHFDLSGGRLRRIGRMRALCEMAAGAAGGGRGWIAGWQVLSAFARSAQSGGLRAGGDGAYAQYVETMKGAVDDYATWVRNYDTLTPLAIGQMRTRIEGFAYAPLVSIVMPVYESPPRWLRRCLDSVLAQVYPNWELCIADDCSPSRHVRQILDEYAARDPRIRVHYRQSNGHISEASNTALELARGDYIALLDHDDELPPHALFEVVDAINANRHWRMIYSDEDKIDGEGRRFSPYFKPDWNRELFLGQNFFSHLGVYETALVRQVGGFRKGYEGSQDWDLALRCVEQVKPDQIGHISRVLYHWRAISGSTALGTDEKDYAGDAGLRAVCSHLDRTGQDGTASRLPNGHIVVTRPVPAPLPRVSLIIPTRDNVHLLRMCIGSILEKTDYPDLEILVVDNQSSEAATLAYFEEIGRLPGVRVLAYDAPFNYSAINNFAAAQASGDILGLVNNDIEVESAGWLKEMVGRVVVEDVGAVGAMLLYPDGTIQHAGVIVGVHGVGAHVYSGKPANYPGQMGRALLVQELSAVTAACLLVRKQVFDQVGGLDEQLKVAFNDVDFCLRLGAAGYRNIWTPNAVLYHHESASRGSEDTPEKRARFDGEVRLMEARWGERLFNDPAYNRNLTVTGEPFWLAFPPR